MRIDLIAGIQEGSTEHVGGVIGAVSVVIVVIVVVVIAMFVYVRKRTSSTLETKYVS